MKHKINAKRLTNTKLMEEGDLISILLQTKRLIEAQHHQLYIDTAKSRFNKTLVEMPRHGMLFSSHFTNAAQRLYGIRTSQIDSRPFLNSFSIA